MGIENQGMEGDTRGPENQDSTIYKFVEENADRPLSEKLQERGGEVIQAFDALSIHFDAGLEFVFEEASKEQSEEIVDTVVSWMDLQEEKIKGGVSQERKIEIRQMERDIQSRLNAIIDQM